MDQSVYDQIRQELDTNMLKASNFEMEIERQVFIELTFTRIHKVYKEKHINHGEYVKLINRLATYRQGEYNDYIDVLAGAAMVDMLEVAIQCEIPTFSPEQARQRSQDITDITGIKPIKPETNEG